MWSMWDAPSDRDYYGGDWDDGEDPDNELPPAFEDLAAEEEWIDEQREREYNDCPF